MASKPAYWPGVNQMCFTNSLFHGKLVCLSKNTNYFRFIRVCQLFDYPASRTESELIGSYITHIQGHKN